MIQETSARSNSGAVAHKKDFDALQQTWFITEADGFMGPPGRPGNLIARIAERMRRRVRPEQLISNFIFGLGRHGAIAAIYLGLAYAAKLLFGISVTFNAVR
jgi:hypothetical protein